MPGPADLPISGAAREFLAARFGGLFTELESVVVVTAAAQPLIPNRPDRLGLIAVNLSVNSIYGALTPNPSANNGILISPNGGALVLSVLEDFTLCSRQLSLIAPAGNSNLYVLELLREIRVGAPLEALP